MKTEILQILQMQAEGKLTQDQAAELLAVLADQAREKSAQTVPPSDASAGKGGAPGPRGGSTRSFTASSAAALHGLVDTAIGVGTTIGRAASVFGGEVVEMVHRDEGGNSVTLSKVDAPAGEQYAFVGNTVNVSKIAHVTLRQAEVSGNTVNASKISQLSLTRGQFSQCNVSGSSVSHVTVTGPEAAENGPEVSTKAGFRGVTFNASKFARVQIFGTSSVEVSTIQASAIKDWLLTDSTLRDSKINDAHVAGLTLTKASVRGLTVERGAAHQWKIQGATLQDVRVSGLKIQDVTITGGTWNDVKLRRETALGGRDCMLTESVFENCALSGCEFAGCTFRRTTFRNLNLTGLTVRNIDFTGMTLETEADFRKAAGI